MKAKWGKRPALLHFPFPSGQDFAQNHVLFCDTEPKTTFLDSRERIEQNFMLLLINNQTAC